MAPIAVETASETVPAGTKSVPSVTPAASAAAAPAAPAVAPYVRPSVKAGVPSPSEADRAAHAAHGDSRAPQPDLSSLLPESRAAYDAELARLAQIAADKKPLDWDTLGPDYKYRWALPWFDERYKHTLFKDPHLPPLDHVDVGHRALTLSNPRAFLEGATIDDLTPRFGSSVKGVDLTRLGSSELDQLALYVAERGVVVFEDNEAFIDQGPEELKAFGRHFSPRLHTHQVSGQPKGHNEFHLVYKAPGIEVNNYEHTQDFVSTVWHSDVSFEANPPGTTFLFLFDTPNTGGDTLFSDMREQLRRLSSPYRAFLDGLYAEHSGYEQSRVSAAAGKAVVKRPPVAHIHPIVRTHPVTGERALFVNEGFTTRIPQLKKEESDSVLRTLFKLNADAVDSQIRVRWGKGAVVAWDNRITTHTPVADTRAQDRRHGARITPAAERPFHSTVGVDVDTNAEVNEHTIRV